MSRTWTDTQLIQAVTTKFSMSEVLRELGLYPNSSNAKTIQTHMGRLGLKSEHWAVHFKKWSEEQLTRAVATQFTMAMVLRELGLSPVGGNYKTIRQHILRLGLSTTHWTGQGHLKGKTHSWSVKMPLSELLVENSTYGTNHLSKRLVKEGVLRYECSDPDCLLTTWKGKPISLHLDHKNGVPTDHRLENLRLLCPNCHSQTPTYCGKNIGGPTGT